MALNYKSPYKVKTTAFKSQSRKFILNVLNFIKTTKKQPTILKGEPRIIAAKALNINKNTISSILKTGVSSPEKRKGRKPKFIFDEFDKVSISNIIKEFYKAKIAPTVNLVRNKMKERNIGPPILSRSRVWKVLKTMGYQYKVMDRRVHLTEQRNIKEWRQRFIQKLNQNCICAFPKPVIYLDESWIGCNATAVKGWAPKVMRTKRVKLDHSFQVKTGRGPRLIMVHAGSKDGFVPGALLLKNSKTTDEDYHAEMDGFNFKHWFETCLLPNIPKTSIIVMDNASYHSMSVAPKSSDKVGVMKDWLKKNMIPIPPKAIKKEIWTIVKEEKKNPDHYIMDKLAKNYGHEVIRLPPYQCELNPIELVWGHIKSYVAKNNSTGKIEDIMSLAQQYIEAYDPAVWNKNVLHVDKIAKEYQIQDGFPAVAPQPNQIVIPLNVPDTDSEQSDSEEGDSEEDNSGSDQSDEDLENINEGNDTVPHMVMSETPNSNIQPSTNTSKSKRPLFVRHLNFQ